MTVERFNAALSGILFVLQTGIPWEDLPQELRFRQWHDLLASPTRLAGQRRLGTPALGSADSIA